MSTSTEKNGLAERRHRYITELGLSMMFQSSLPQKLWVEAFYTGAFLGNLLPNSVNNKMMSPFELLNGKAPVYTALIAFGCACYPYLRLSAQNKFDPKSLLCVFVGYNERYKGYRCYHPPTGRVYINRHVFFYEERLPYKDTYQHLLTAPTTPLSSAWRLQFPTAQEAPPSDETSSSQEDIGRTVSVKLPTVEVPVNQQSLPVTDNHQEQSTDGSSSSSSNSDEEQEDQAVVEPPPQATDNSHGMTTRSKVGVRKPNPRYALITVKGIPQEPKSVAEALSHPGWNGSMKEEIDTCEEIGTWSVVPLPPDVQPIGCRWIYKTKLNADGTFKSLRSRLVAKGNEQEEGVNFLETYSPVVRTATVRLVLHFAVTEKWDIRQLDVKNAFLHGDLAETVYMRQSPGFEHKNHLDHVCLLHKAIYGLKQSPRAWFDKFSSYLVEFGFICNIHDPSLFVYQKEKDVIFLLLYVDDMVITGNNKILLQQLLKSLNKQFRMKDLGTLSYFLGIQQLFLEKRIF